MTLSSGWMIPILSITDLTLVNVVHNCRKKVGLSVKLWRFPYNRNYSAILATLQITSYALGV
jgi:hypothetical protein